MKKIVLKIFIAIFLLASCSKDKDGDDIFFDDGYQVPMEIKVFDRHWNNLTQNDFFTSQISIYSQDSKKTSQASFIRRQDSENSKTAEVILYAPSKKNMEKTLSEDRTRQGFGYYTVKIGDRQATLKVYFKQVFDEEFFKERTLETTPFCVAFDHLYPTKVELNGKVKTLEKNNMSMFKLELTYDGEIELY